MVPLLFILITPAWRLKSSPQMPGSLSLQVEKQQFQIRKLFNGRGCQRPTTPARCRGLDRNWAGTWGGRRQNFWQVEGLMGLPDHDEVHGRAHLPCWSPGLTLLCTSSEPCTVHQLQRGRAGRTDRKEEHTNNVDK